jgi:hypothetical protein
MRTLTTLGLAFVITTTAGCFAAPYDKEEDGSSTNRVVSSNARTVFQYFKDKGLSDVQSAGIVGNFQWESTQSINPSQNEVGGGAGRGIAQWGVHGRWANSADHDNLQWYAGQHHQQMATLLTQLDFTWYELTTFSRYGLAQLRAATTVESAVHEFMNRFERPNASLSHEADRLRYARDVLAQLGNGDTSSSATTTDDPNNADPAATDDTTNGKGGADDTSTDDGSTDDGTNGKGGDTSTGDGSTDDGTSGKGGDTSTGETSGGKGACTDCDDTNTGGK